MPKIRLTNNTETDISLKSGETIEVQIDEERQRGLVSRYSHYKIIGEK